MADSYVYASAGIWCGGKPGAALLRAPKHRMIPTGWTGVLGAPVVGVDAY